MYITKWDKPIEKHESIKLITVRTKGSMEESMKSTEESKNGLRIRTLA